MIKLLKKDYVISIKGKERIGMSYYAIQLGNYLNYCLKNNHGHKIDLKKPDFLSSKGKIEFSDLGDLPGEIILPKENA